MAKKQKPVLIRFSMEQYQEVERRAEKELRSISSYIRSKALLG